MASRAAVVSPRARTHRQRVVRIPAGPRCTVCGHPACPCCAANGGAWCDVVTPDCELCCDGECSYPDAEALRAWTAEIEPLLEQAFRTGGEILTIDDGEASTPPAGAHPAGTSAT